LNDLTVVPPAPAAPHRSRRLSPWRVLLGVGVVVALAGASYGTWQYWNATRPVAAFSPWFTGYVDVTATPIFPFETPSSDAPTDVVLSFVVASSDEECTPSWGTYYGLDSAAENLDLDRRVARLVQLGGEVSVSFGGAANSELATVCTDPGMLAAAYAAVIDRYDLTTIDLDIEGANLSDATAGLRRATAIKTVQDDMAAAGDPLNVWLTLPAAPQGLTDEGIQAVTQMVEANVQLAGVNSMTMDYGDGRDEGETMAAASIRTLNAVHGQLSDLYTAHSIDLTSAEVWTKMGATPMVGQNDVSGEIFGLMDARALNRFATTSQLGRISMWSLNRDAPCGENYVDLTVVSDACSGVDQGFTLFADVLGSNLVGVSGTQAVPVGTVADGQLMEPADEIIDDPVTSPYVVWSADAVFEEQTKIVWHGQVYEAKWWSRGDLPDDPAVKSYDTPWTLIGPVLPTDVPRVQIELPAGTYPEWSPGTAYQTPDRVMLGAVPYQTKWWTQGDSPEGSLVSENGGPWRLLTGAEVTAVITGEPEVTPAP